MRMCPGVLPLLMLAGSACVTSFRRICEFVDAVFSKAKKKKRIQCNFNKDLVPSLFCALSRVNQEKFSARNEGDRVEKEPSHLISSRFLEVFAR